MGNGCTSVKAVKLVEATSQLPKLKLVVVGETSSGKSSIVERFEKNRYNESYEPTTIANIVSIVKKVNIPDQGIVTLEVWDVPGYEQTDVRKTYYLNADAIIVVVDISDGDAYDYAIQWKRDAILHLRHTTHKHSNDSSKAVHNDNSKLESLEQIKPKVGSVPVLLLGNKFDLAKESYLREQYSLYDANASKVTFNVNNMHPYSHVNNNNNSSNPEIKVSHETDGNVEAAISVSHCDIDDQQQQPDGAEQENPPKSNNTEDAGNKVDDSSVVESTTVGEVAENAHQEDSAMDVASEEPHDGKVTKVINEKIDTDEIQQTCEVQNGNDLTQGKPDDHATSTMNQQCDVDDEIPVKVDESRQLAVVNANDDHVTSSLKQDNNIGNGSAQQSEDASTSPSGDKDTDDHMVASTQKKLKKLFPKDLIIQENGGDKVKKNQEVNSISNLQELGVPPTSGSIITTSSLLPPCVDILETFAEDNGFIAGIPVSAKDPKGGVHEAIQSLVRHLVNKVKENTVERKRKTDEISMKSHLSVTKRTRKSQYHSVMEDFEPLQEVGIVEIDEVLRKCNPALREVEDLTTAYRESIHDFKKACYKRQLIGGSQVSLEECVAALKDALQSSNRGGHERNDIRVALLMRDEKPNYTLESTEIDGFLDLQVVDSNGVYINYNESDNTLIPHDIVYVLNIYHEKVHRSCSSVVETSSQLEQVLNQLYQQIAAKEEKAWDAAVAAGHSQGNVRKILAGMAQSKARLRGTLEQMKDTRRLVITTQTRIRATLLF